MKLKDKILKMPLGNSYIFKIFYSEQDCVRVVRQIALR